MNCARTRSNTARSRRQKDASKSRRKLTKTKSNSALHGRRGVGRLFRRQLAEVLGCSSSKKPGEPTAFGRCASVFQSERRRLRTRYSPGRNSDEKFKLRRYRFAYRPNLGYDQNLIS